MTQNKVFIPKGFTFYELERNFIFYELGGGRGAYQKYGFKADFLLRSLEVYNHFCFEFIITFVKFYSGMQFDELKRLWNNVKGLVLFIIVFQEVFAVIFIFADKHFFVSD